VTTLTLDPGGRPKSYVIERAFGHLHSAGYEFEHTPEEIKDALENLDMLMSEEPWNLLGYNQPRYGAGKPTDSSGLPDNAIFAASYRLAQRLAGLWSTSLQPETIAAGHRAEALLFSAYCTPPTQPMAASTPRGMGWRRTSLSPFTLPE
jgi:hypothetical protein